VNRIRPEATSTTNVEWNSRSGSAESPANIPR
jgi:hypothetical protein